MRSRLVLLILLFLPLVLTAQQRRDDVLVEFTLKGNAYHALINRKGWKQSETVRLCDKSALEDTPFGSSLYQPESAQKVYRLIVKPLARYLEPGDRVFFVPAGNLHFINLSALSDETGQSLCDIYHFHRLSSLDRYTLNKDKPYRAEWLLFGAMDYHADPEKMYAASRMTCHTHNVEHLYKDIVPESGKRRMTFGVAEDGTRAGYNNLEYGRGEIKDIWALRDFALIFETGYHASEEMFRFHVRRNTPYIVLLSTHSFTSEDDGTGTACGLLFSGAGWTIDGEKLPYNLNDGILYSQEIETLDMHSASMVVLAACNTALGVVTQEGIEGLQTAFKKAGAQSLIMTLWSVNDKATAAFTTSLFKYIDKTGVKTKHEAFEAAIRDMRNSEDFSDPTYWAPFIMLD